MTSAWTQILHQPKHCHGFLSFSIFKSADIWIFTINNYIVNRFFSVSPIAIMIISCSNCHILPILLWPRLDTKRKKDTKEILFLNCHIKQTFNLYLFQRKHKVCMQNEKITDQELGVRRALLVMKQHCINLTSNKTKFQTFMIQWKQNYYQQNGKGNLIC